MLFYFTIFFLNKNQKIYTNFIFFLMFTSVDICGGVIFLGFRLLWQIRLVVVVGTPRKVVEILNWLSTYIGKRKKSLFTFTFTCVR